MGQAEEIGSAGTDDRKARATQICNHQFARLPCGGLLASLRVDYFDNKFAFDEMNPTRLEFTFKTVSAHFGSACMIEALGSPCCFNARLHPCDVCSRLSGVNQRTDGKGSHVKMIFASDFRQPQSIGWGAAYHRRSKIAHHVQALDREIGRASCRERV